MSSVWALAYHLCGITMLSRTVQEPLGTLPVPLRSAVLRTAAELDAETLEVQVQSKLLMFAEGRYTWVSRWRFLDEEVQRHLTGHGTLTQTSYGSVEEFYRQYRLLEKTKDEKGRERDEHFAERIFIEETFLPVFGLAGLAYLTPQAAFVDGDGRRRRIDFLLNTGKKYALEVEGRRYHSSEFQNDAQFDDEKARQRELAKAGIAYFPFSFADIRSGRAEAILNELAFEDRILHRLFKEQDKMQAAPAGKRQNAAMYPLDHLLKGLPEHFQAYQRMLLALLRDASQARKRTLTLLDYEPVTPILALAVFDTLSLVERVSELYDVPVQLPEVHIVALRPQDPDLYQRLLTAYPLTDKAFPDAPRTGVQLTVKEQVFSLDGVDHLFAGPGSKNPPSEALTTGKLERASAKVVSEVGFRPPLNENPATTDRALLDFFARRYFTVPELKKEQAELVQRALTGESGLGILPTGFGKSLVFQLYAMMVPRTTLVISPLKALIRDQVHAMHRIGLGCVDAITSSDSSSVKDRKLADFRAHKYRLLYISPERLQIKSFYDELRATMQQTPVGAFVIDEAHCVSEWGHDFRPAYLQIGGLRLALQQASDRSIPILAMTATASEPVRRDILSVLHLDGGNVVQLSSSDRPNLSLSVHPISSPIGDKADVVEDLFTNILPKVLKKPFEKLIPHGQNDGFQDAGVVFGVYANPHGRGTIAEGVHAIAKVLRERITHDRDLVRIHASTPPTVCPECKSQLFVPMSASERKLAGFTDAAGNRCLECGHTFLKPETPSDWDTSILETQDAFQNNAFPILVATKGYGMGIDKQNLRYIVHHALSSGLEAYYQEAGRAGRDGRHSHVALTYMPPVRLCEVEHLDEGQAPPCVSEKRNFMFHKCPYGLSTLCDYGKQARFIRSSYVGVDEDLQTVMEVYGKLCGGEPDGLTESMRKRPRWGTLSVCEDRKCHWGRSPTLPSCPDPPPDRSLERHPQRADSRLDGHWPAAFPAQHSPGLAAAHPLQCHLRPEHRTPISSVAGESSHRPHRHLRATRDPCLAELGRTHPDPGPGHQCPL